MPDTIKVDGEEQSLEQATEAFNDYFLNITKNLNLQSAKENSISLLKNYYPSEFPPMQIIPVTELSHYCHIIIFHYRKAITQYKPLNVRRPYWRLF
jgi:hypothetical protein